MSLSESCSCHVLWFQKVLSSCSAFPMSELILLPAVLRRCLSCTADMVVCCVLCLCVGGAM